MWKLVTVAVVAVALAGCGVSQIVPAQGASSGSSQDSPSTDPAPSPWVPALTDPVIAAPGGADGVGYMCWNAYGSPLNQESPICPPGWGGRPPEHPLPTGDPGEGSTP